MPDRALPPAVPAASRPAPSPALSPAAEVELGALEATLPPVRRGGTPGSGAGGSSHPNGDPPR
jgi:hypothetical protein